MNRPCPRPRKIITRVIVYLLLGAIVNVAVAWGFYCVSDITGVPIILSSDQAKSIMPVRAPAEAPMTGVTGHRLSARGVAMYELLAFHYEVTDDGPIRYANRLHVFHSGWPAYSIVGWFGIGRTPTEIGSHGLWRER